MSAFWSGPGRELPPPSELRKTTPLTDHWRVRGKFKRNHQLIFELLQKASDLDRGARHRQWLERQFESSLCHERKAHGFT